MLKGWALVKGSKVIVDGVFIFPNQSLVTISVMGQKIMDIAIQVNAVMESFHTNQYYLTSDP